MFSLKKLTLRKIIIDNSVKYIPQSKQTRYVKPNMIKIYSNARKQNKNVSQSKKTYLKMWQQEDLASLNE